MVKNKIYTKIQNGKNGKCERTTVVEINEREQIENWIINLLSK